MDNSLKLGCTVGLVVAISIVSGLWCVGKAIKTQTQIENVSTSGSAEKKIKSDIVEVKLTIKNKNEDLNKLYEKRIADRKNVTEFLKSCGINKEDIISLTAKSENLGEREGSWGQLIVSNQEKYFSTEDTLFIKTKNFEAVDKMKDGIMQLAGKGIIISYKCKYKILDLKSLRTELVAEAVKDAEENAKNLVRPFGKKIKNVYQIYDNGMEVMNETQNSTWSSWERDGDHSSLMKKVSMRVHASFTFK